MLPSLVVLSPVAVHAVADVQDTPYRTDPVNEAAAAWALVLGRARPVPAALAISLPAQPGTGRMAAALAVSRTAAVPCTSAAPRAAAAAPAGPAASAPAAATAASTLPALNIPVLSRMTYLRCVSPR